MIKNIKFFFTGYVHLYGYRFVKTILTSIYVLVSAFFGYFYVTKPYFDKFNFEHWDKLICSLFWTGVLVFISLVLLVLLMKIFDSFSQAVDNSIRAGKRLAEQELKKQIERESRGS